MYSAAHPEELSFHKNDILAISRHGADGWWEAELVDKNGATGLVPSNYMLGATAPGVPASSTEKIARTDTEDTTHSEETDYAESLASGAHGTLTHNPAKDPILATNVSETTPSGSLVSARQRAIHAIADLIKRTGYKAPAPANYETRRKIADMFKIHDRSKLSSELIRNRRMWHGKELEPVRREASPSILSRAPLNFKEFASPLHLAAGFGDTKVVAEWLKARRSTGKNKSAFNLKYMLLMVSPLHCAAMGGYYNIVEQLLDDDYHVDIDEDSGLGTPLSLAILLHRLDVVELLLRRDASFDTEASTMTPVHAACLNGNTGVLLALLHGNPNIDAPLKSSREFNRDILELCTTWALKWW
jgi:hypothetical protein